MHQTGPLKLQLKEVASQVPMSPGAVSQVLESRTATVESAPLVLVQLLQLPVPVVALLEADHPVRTQPYQKDGGP